MSLERAKEHLKKFNKENDIKLFDVSSATVELAAKALGCRPEFIAKTLSFKLKDRVILIVFAGDAYLQLPLTTDFVSAKQYIDIVSPEMVSTQGTAIAEAIKNKEQERKE